MKLSRSRKILAVLATILIPAAAALAVGCHPTTHAFAPVSLGQARSSTDLDAVIDVPGPVTVETVNAADWEVDRGGLINLDHPKAKAAGLKDGPEPIQIYFHALRHPQKGLFLVDSGVERAFQSDREHAAVRGIVTSFMSPEKMKVHVDTATWLAAQKEPLAGVFLTHLHLDHVMGLPDVPKETPVYVGPGENRDRDTLNVVVQGVLDRATEGLGPLREMAFSPDPTGTFAGVLDVFGDGSVWALLVPGHTNGSVAYLVRTPSGPVLLTGDTCHTSWGWNNGVEPGSFTHDRAENAVSLSRLRNLVARHPSIDVRLGHQPFAKAQP
ncbi:MAG: MBL fold metallo-hydrolase [Polyangiaceae bacterium]